MSKIPDSDLSRGLWTLKKAVTTLAIAPINEPLTRGARMAYNVMIYLSQRMEANAEGGYSAPLSQILKCYGTTTRDSTRAQAYIDQMQTTLIRWFPLTVSDETQSSIEGVEPGMSIDSGEDGRTFTLLSEARYSRRSGEKWVMWFFPPTIRSMIIEPTRWAQVNIQEMALLSHYASVALYEICSRYKELPGGLTNKADPSWWVRALRSDPDSKPREWRKFKNENLRSALAEISQLTSLQIELIEHKRGRTVDQVQFAVKRKKFEPIMTPVDISLVEEAHAVGVKERDLDALVDEFGEEKVRKAINNIQVRNRAQPATTIKHPLAYLKQTLRNDRGSLFDVKSESETPPTLPPMASANHQTADSTRVAQRERAIGAELDNLTPEELEHYARLAHDAVVKSGLLTPAMQKRFDNKQYRAPMIWHYIRTAYAIEQYGADWKL